MEIAIYITLPDGGGGRRAGGIEGRDKDRNYVAGSILHSKLLPYSPWASFHPISMMWKSK